ncbi:hypothetical protein Bca52824_016172 [Brassica carinata]|uniref:Uncharacterized protein n=1 Tax=Brassica carinata TaxID=52824 RepID=A0A8X8B3U5_BRACI|nr:hypothetical protein Bca52824_016172 [Brassica carinata]
MLPGARPVSRRMLAPGRPLTRVGRAGERVPAKKSDDLFSKDKGVDIRDLDFSVDDSDLPGWDPNLAFGNGSGSSDMPLPDFDNFFDGLPKNPDPPPLAGRAGEA